MKEVNSPADLRRLTPAEAREMEKEFCRRQARMKPRRPGSSIQDERIEHSAFCELMMRLGRAFSSLPDLITAEQKLRNTPLGPETAHALLLASWVVASWRLHLGQIAPALEVLARARAILKQHRRTLSQHREMHETMQRRLENQAKMAQGILPAFPWEAEGFMNEMAVPPSDLPHLVLLHCWLALRFGAEAQALALLERLCRALEDGQEEGDEVVLLHMQAWNASHLALEDQAQRWQQSKGTA